MELLPQTDPHGLPVLAPGWALLVDITGGGGTSELNKVIRGCIGSICGIGDDLDVKQGQSEGFKHGVEDLIALDPDAYWDPDSKTIKDSCVETHSCCRYVDGSTTTKPGLLVTGGGNVSPSAAFTKVTLLVR